MLYWSFYFSLMFWIGIQLLHLPIILYIRTIKIRTPRSGVLLVFNRRWHWTDINKYLQLKGILYHEEVPSSIGESVCNVTSEVHVHYGIGLVYGTCKNISSEDRCKVISDIYRKTMWSIGFAISSHWQLCICLLNEDSSEGTHMRDDYSACVMITAHAWLLQRKWLEHNRWMTYSKRICLVNYLIISSIKQWVPLHYVLLIKSLSSGDFLFLVKIHNYT